MRISTLSKMGVAYYNAYQDGEALEKARLAVEKTDARVLAEGKMTIGEISERVGYAKQSQFAAAFRKRFGVSPKEY